MSIDEDIAIVRADATRNGHMEFDRFDRAALRLADEVERLRQDERDMDAYDDFTRDACNYCGTRVGVGSDYMCCDCSLAWRAGFDHPSRVSRTLLEKAEAERDMWRNSHPAESLRWYTEWKRAETDLAAARARVDDFEHMPCEECLTFAPGPDLSHLIAEKNRCMKRAFAAEAALRAVLDLCDEDTDGLAWAAEVRRVIAEKLGVTDV